MKIGFFGDVHGNLPALRACYQDALDRGCERFVSLGDIVGGFGWPDECVEFVESHMDMFVVGNHEMRIHPETTFVPESHGHRKEHRLVTSSLTESSVESILSWSDTLNFEQDGYSFHIAHANPFESPHNGYPATNYVDKRSWTSFASDHLETGDVCVFGHTHDAGAIDCEKFDGIAGRIINPGDVGTDIESDSHWASFDTDSGECELHRVYYPSVEVTQRLAQVDMIHS